MVGRPAARVLDMTIHPLPGTLLPGPGSFNVIIGKKFAWRAIPAAAAAGLSAAKATSDTAIKVAEANTVAMAATPAGPGALAAEQTLKTSSLQAMNSAITSVVGSAKTPSGGSPDFHLCLTPSPVPPHGMGVVRDGSLTVMINGLPASRMGDHLIEAIGPENIIILGEFTVLIGDDMGAAGPAPPPVPPTPNAAIYATQDEAARAALNLANPQSVQANLEYGGMIYRDPVSGKYGFTGPAQGTAAGFNPSQAPIPAGTTPAGDYHCHADYSQPGPGGTAIRTSDPANDGYNSDNFSGTDYNGIANDATGNPGYKGYLGTPSGTFRQYDPATGSDTTL